jgi:hypothetical protein
LQEAPVQELKLGLVIDHNSALSSNSTVLVLAMWIFIPETPEIP